MPRTLIIQDTELTAGGGTVNLNVDNYVDQYRLFTSGAVTLTSSYTIQSSGTITEGMLYEFHYVADLDFDGNTLTIFGTSVPEDLESVEMYIRAYYNGASWEVTMTPSLGALPIISTNMIIADAITTAKVAADAIDTAEIAADAITPVELATDSVIEDKVKDGAITINKLGGTLDKEIFIIDASFETGEQGDNSIIVPFDCTLNSVRYNVKKLVEATDDGTITPQINGVGTTPPLITVAGGSVINDNSSTAISGGGSITAGQVLKLASSKTTAGGKVLLTVTVTRA